MFSQTKAELQQQRVQLKKEMQQINKLLFSEQKKQKNALEELNDINKKIEIRRKLINTINAESRLLQRDIRKSEKEIIQLNKKLDDLKASYADMIYKSYKSRSQQSKLMFILASNNVFQAYKRVAYMRQYTAFRKKQGKEIEEQTKVAQNMKDSLLIQKKEKDVLLAVEKTQKKLIEGEKSNQQKLIAVIKDKEGSFKKELQKKLREERRITAKIDKIIREEIARANKKKNKKPAKRNEFVLSPEAKALASRFEQNRGKLPWPVKEGLIVRRFGNQPHPSFPGITVNGTGLHIVTAEGNPATAIFSGTVLNVLLNSEGRKNVLIQHGNYVSSYNNLETIYVNKGDKVTTGQDLGKIFTDKVSGKTTLKFVIFKNTTRLNPSSWILRR
ncbi:peptidoglycan DD-metalloendopeptidase family protein [Polaribacter sp.]|nr:peptidoglycan DD-metalloendopeptidase family protein [Polaribacter sp.]